MFCFCNNAWNCFSSFLVGGFHLDLTLDICVCVPTYVFCMDGRSKALVRCV